MGHTSGALRSRNFASSARGLRPDGKTPRCGWRGGWVKSNRTSQAVLGGPDQTAWSTVCETLDAGLPPKKRLRELTHRVRLMP